MKSYTDIKQSKKLAEILPIKSADMFWANGERPAVWNNKDISLDDTDIPAWSLAALLNYLKSKNKFPEIKELSDGCFKLTTFIWDGKNSIQFSIADNLIDACYEIILKLHKEKLI